MRRIAIIGGGLSGVATAYQLAQEGNAEFTLFEAAARLGGIVETVRRDGFIIECGPDSWVTEKPWARELAIELGLEAEIIASNDHQRRTYLLEDKRLIPMPDGLRMMVPTQWAPVLNSPLFSWQARLAYLRELRRAEELKKAALGEGEDESVASFVRRHFGDEVTQTVAGPLLAGVFGGSIDTLSVRAVMPGFVKMEREHGSLIAALQKRETSSEPVFTSLKAGLGTLIERAAETLPNGTVQVEDEVHAITQEGGRWRVQTTELSGVFDALIMATPAHVTRRLLARVHAEFEPLLSMDVTSAIVVALAFSAERAKDLRIPRGFGYLVPQRPGSRPVADAGPQLLACTFVDQKFAHRAPEGAVLLRGFFGGDMAPALLTQDDAALVVLAHRRLSQALGPLPEPDISLVRRWPLSLPQYSVGHLDRMAKLAAIVDGFPGLHLVGNAYYGVGLPDLVRQGRDAARKATRL